MSGLNLQLQGSEHVRILINGALVGEWAGGWVGQADLAREVHEARCYAVLAQFLARLVVDARGIATRPDHVNGSEEKRRAAYARGLLDGFILRTVPYPAAGVHPIRPETSPSYDAGYRQGEGLGMVLHAVAQEEQSGDE